MYSLLLMTAVAGSPDAAAFGWRSGGCNGCHGAVAVGCCGLVLRRRVLGVQRQRLLGLRLQRVLVVQRVPGRRVPAGTGCSAGAPPQGVVPRLLGLLVPRLVVAATARPATATRLGGAPATAAGRVRLLGVVLRQRDRGGVLGLVLRQLAAGCHGGACYGASVGPTAGSARSRRPPVMTAPVAPAPAAPATGGTSVAGSGPADGRAADHREAVRGRGRVAGAGTTRQFHTPDLPAGESFFYDLRAEVEVNGTVQTEEKRVVVRAGETVAASFAKLAAAVSEASAVAAK